MKAAACCAISSIEVGTSPLELETAGIVEQDHFAVLAKSGPVTRGIPVIHGSGKVHKRTAAGLSIFAPKRRYAKRMPAASNELGRRCSCACSCSREIPEYCGQEGPAVRQQLRQADSVWLPVSPRRFRPAMYPPAYQFSPPATASDTSARAALAQSMSFLHRGRPAQPDRPRQFLPPP